MSASPVQSYLGYEDLIVRIQMTGENIRIDLNYLQTLIVTLQCWSHVQKATTANTLPSIEIHRQNMILIPI